MANGRRVSIHPQAGGITITELVARYWGHAKGYYQKNGEPNTSLNSIKDALGPLKQLYGRTLASEFGPLALPDVGLPFALGDLAAKSP